MKNSKRILTILLIAVVMISLDERLVPASFRQYGRRVYRQSAITLMGGGIP